MNWTKTTPVIMYGAATVATTFYRQLHTRINVVAFIDKRADEIDSMFQLPVYRVDSGELNDLKQSAVVIVCVKNVFDHESIALALLENGFRHILFMPLKNSAFEYSDISAKKELERLYSKLQNDDLQFPVSVPSSDGLLRRRFSDALFIKEKGDKVVVNVPLVFVHTDLGEGSEWFDIPVLALFPHIDFFSYLGGNWAAEYKSYLDIFCLGVAKQLNTFVPTKSWYENVFKNRANVYEKMKMEYDTDPSFFIEQAVEATWNERGYFNLNGGKHRIAFLASRESLTAPLVLNHDDYETFMNRSAADKVIASREASGSFTVPYWIPHPLFADMECRIGINAYNVFYRLVRWLARQLYENEHRLWNYKSISVFNSGPAVFTLLFQLLSCNVVSSSENQDDKDIAALFKVTQDRKSNGCDLGIFQGDNDDCDDMGKGTKYVCICTEDKGLADSHENSDILGVFWNNGMSNYLIVYRNGAEQANA